MLNSLFGIIQRIPGLWSSVGTRQCLVPTGIYRSGMYFINVESAVLYVPTIRTVSGLTHGARNPVSTNFAFSNEKYTKKPGF